ncbi:MAG: class I SAM-dependent methyltransferase [Nitrospirae bacterium]|jgi:SAM-dependent methyltransferase|nr:class I SAM-dependent methyltransferase [Nitrospirota bacterium]
MFIAKLIPSRIFSLQARRPSGWFGRVVMSRIFNKGNADLNNFIKDLLDLQEHDRVLEIGSGPGTLLNQMAQLTTKGLVEGIDFSDAMLDQARKTNKQYISTKRIKIQKGNGNDLPYGHESFDKVCTSNTIYFFDNPIENFKEIFRVLKPGGKFVVGFRDKAQMKKLPLSDDVFKVYTQDEVKIFLLNSGFSDVRIEEKEGKPFVSYCAVATKT